MKCDGSPDPTILPEINMYMSLWREDLDNNLFEMVLKDSDLVLKVISIALCFHYIICFDLLKF